MSGSIHFELPEGATDETLVKERKKLQKLFREYLTAMLTNLEVEPGALVDWTGLDQGDENGQARHETSE